MVSTAVVGEAFLKAVIYTRISSDDGTSLGVRRQEEDCRELALRRGWTVTAVYTDNDISASNGKPRPAYRRMLGDLREGLAGAVIVWDLDRLHRRPK
ncbi:MAG TPA: recombinase family protein, partial [Actinomycetes bacterium]